MRTSPSPTQELIRQPNTAFASIQNGRDKFVIEQLYSVPVSGLPIDQFAHLLCKKGETVERDHIVALRHAFIRVYVEAMGQRLNAKATSKQIACARKALSSFSELLEHLNNVGPSTLRGLQSVFGTSVDDPSGLHESNDFHSACSLIRLNTIPNMLMLWQATERETSKPSRPGERKKRLRILVECLVDWWMSVTGKFPAPYVKAKRRDDAPAVMIGRQGEFLRLAHALFCEVDNFSDSEVVACVTNVHEDHLARAKKYNSASNIRLVYDLPI